MKRVEKKVQVVDLRKVVDEMVRIIIEK